MQLDVDNEPYLSRQIKPESFAYIIYSKTPSCNFRLLAIILSVIWIFKSVTDRGTESDAYEPTVQYAQVGSIKNHVVERLYYNWDIFGKPMASKQIDIFSLF